MNGMDLLLGFSKPPRKCRPGDGKLMVGYLDDTMSRYLDNNRNSHIEYTALMSSINRS